MNTLSLSQKQSDAWHYLHDNVTTEVMYGGGAGGGKSMLGCLNEIDGCNRYPGTRGIIGRAVLKSIKDSTLVTYEKVCKILGYQAGVDYKLNSQDMVIKWVNGSVTVFKEMEHKPSDPNFERLGSTEYTRCFIDEAGEVVEKASDIINSRLRWMLTEFCHNFPCAHPTKNSELIRYELIEGNKTPVWLCAGCGCETKGLTPKSLLSANPNHNWVKFKYIKDQDGNLIKLKPHQKYVRALVDDNPDEGFKANYKQQLSRMGSQYDIDRLLFGDWDAMPRTGGEFLKKFSRESHVRKTEWIKGDSILLSFDENVNPYVTCLVFQVRKHEWGKEYVQIDEICLPDPLNRVKYVCNEFKRRYQRQFVPKLFYYGDATSQKEDTKKEKGENFFTDVHNHLQEYSPVKMVPNANPSVIDSGQFVDQILAGAVDGLMITIGENCHKSVHDYSYAKEDSDGTILKKKIKHPETGVSYEEHGHHIDALRYIIAYAEPGAYAKCRRGYDPTPVIVGGRQPDSSKHY
jgi:phage terminase large subunit